MEPSRILLEYVIPCFGLILTWTLYLSSFSAIRQAHRSGDLGKLNPYPNVLQLFNGCSWVVYGTIVPMPTAIYCLLGNLPGAILGTYYTLVCYGLTTKEKRDIMITMSVVLGTVIGISFWFGIYFLPVEKAQVLVGVVTNIILFAFYGSPLSTIVEVLKTKNSSSIYWPLSVTTAVSASLWTCFGFAVGDYFIAVPNFAGTTLAVIQLVLVSLYRTRVVIEEEEEAEKPQL